MAPRIERVVVRAFEVPVQGGEESDGTLTWTSTGVITVELSLDGVTGLGWSYGHPAAAQLLDEKLAPRLRGADPARRTALVWALLAETRNLGRQGIAACALSAIDTALWDLAARMHGVPLVDLFGRARERVRAYGSGGFTSLDERQLAAQLEGWVAQGFRSVKMKVGREPHRDVDRVRRARRAIGGDVELMVDANGAYHPQQALQLAQGFADEGVTWFEEPVGSDDVAGLRWLRERLPPGMRVAAGEYGWGPWDVRPLVVERAVDVLMPDATRCLGYSGFQRAAALAGIFHVPVSAHCAPALHVHVACALPEVLHLEWFHDHARLERLIFDGAPDPVEGHVAPDLSRPGHGVSLRADAGRFAT